MFYHVCWEIELEADSAKEAAQLALNIQRDANSTATVFTVTVMDDEYPVATSDCEPVTIDANDEEAQS